MTAKMPKIVEDAFHDALFDPATTSPPKCKACGATDRRDCEHDRDRELGMTSVTRKRPKTCLGSYDPTTARIPF